MTTSPFLLAVFVLAIVPFASGQDRPPRRLGKSSKNSDKSGKSALFSKSSKNSSGPSSTKAVPATPQLVASGVVCESRGTCLVEGSRCTRGYETCFGETFDSFICDCVDIDGGGNIEYSCRFTDACRTAPTEIFRQPSPSSAKAGKAFKSSKGSSKSSKAYSEAQGIFYPVAPPGSAKSSKAYGSSKSSKAYGSSKSSKVYESTKAAKGSTKAFKSSKGYVNLFTQESDIVIITNAPTNDPTNRPTNDPSNAPTNRPTSEPTKRIIRSFSIDQCTGDPCPIETYCRSSYGNCGPGSMYCNSFSSWKQACPAAPTTMTPTPKPTTEPTGNPTSSEPTVFPSYGELLAPPRPATPSPTTTGPTVGDPLLTSKFVASVDTEELFLVQEGSLEESFETSDSGLKEEDARPKTRVAVDDKKKPSGLALGLGLGLGALLVIGLVLVGVHHRRSLLTEALPE